MKLDLTCKFWDTIAKWKISKWLFLKIRNFLLWTNMHSERQSFHIGWLKKEYNKSDLHRYLKKIGFENIVYAWIDEDEVLSMRKLCKKRFQYHIRLHKDGNIRGHFEYAPDRHPIDHLNESIFKLTPKLQNILSDFLEKNKNIHKNQRFPIAQPLSV